MEEVEITEVETTEVVTKKAEKKYYDQRSVAIRTIQSVYFVQEQDKIKMLDLLLQNYKDTQIVILVKSKKKADILRNFLQEKSFAADSVHGNHRKEKQKESASVFNSGKLNIIVTTDMILKQLELEDIKFVINYDLPDIIQEYYNRLTYMHEKGSSVAFVSPEDDALLSNIELNMKQEIPEELMEGFIASKIVVAKKTLRKGVKRKKKV